MKTPSKLFIIASICSCALVAQQSLAEKPAMNQGSKATAPSKGDAEIGFSITNPIILKGFKTYKKVREKQMEYIQQYEEEGYSILCEQFSLEDNQRFIEGFVLSNDDGKYIEIYFDITDICKSARRLKDKNLQSMMKEAKEFKDKEPEIKARLEKELRNSIEAEKRLKDSVDTEK